MKHRERPFDLKGGKGRGGGYVFFLKKYSDFGGEKKKSDSEFLSYNLMFRNIFMKDVQVDQSQVTSGQL